MRPATGAQKSGDKHRALLGVGAGTDQDNCECLCPRPDRTFPRRQCARSDGEARYLSDLPMGGFGRPAEVTAKIAVLLSEEAGFMRGQTLFVDGGASLETRALREVEDNSGANHWCSTAGGSDDR
ncbi:SDR family oxidoreductase [Frigidibacter sp. MR17.14]|uniref:SDR family oxidoreductase n=1 Tax=Frigidibacter sp. MR17.14 TaxID=3126509 RepID=UPI003FA612D1